MLLLYNIPRWGKGLHKCSLTNFSTSTKLLKWPSILRSGLVTKYEKSKSVKIWDKMTIWDLTKSMKKDLEFTENVLKPVLENNYDISNGKINDLQVVKKFLKKEQIKFELINPILDPILPKEVKKKRIILGCDKEIKGDEVKRPPVVTIMGHVDHGKTTLLDALRNSNVVDHEFGGITQHIGAFSVSLTPGNSVTFIDTPGHAAFSAMRSRGAEITDIVVLIVAADDGVMEQTIESIRMAKNSGVKIIVAVNKIDKAPSDNLVKIKQQLLEEGVQAEDLGGDVQVIPISALKRQNLDKLIEALLLEAEIMSLTGDPNGPFEGVIVESFIRKSGWDVNNLITDKESAKCCLLRFRKFATVIVKRGTLRKRVLLLAGQAFARVRGMYNEDGVELSEVTLSQPALISGWRDLPEAGDKVIEVKKERDARGAIKQERQEEMRGKVRKDYQVIQEKAVQAASDYVQRKNYISELKKTQNIEALKQMFIKQPEYIPKDRCKLDLVIKGDVHGSVEAILSAISTYDCIEQCNLKVVHFGVGSVTESDIELAETFNATIYCFNLPFPEGLKSLIVEKGLRIKFHNVIYKFFDDLKEEINSLLPIKEEEVIVGTAEVLQHFTITESKKKVPTAGCMCVAGELRRDLSYKVLRDEKVIHIGKLKSMKHYKNEVNIIKKDTQCGIMFQDFTEEFKPGDKIICYDTEMKKEQLNWNPGF